MEHKKVRIFNNLIKLHKNKLHDLFIMKNDMCKKRDYIATSLNELEVAERLESTRYFGSEYAFMLEAYLKNVAIKKDDLRTRLRNLENDITLMDQALNAEFAELKKYEIIQMNRENANLKEQKTLETKFFDEIANNNYVNMQNKVQ